MAEEVDMAVSTEIVKDEQLGPSEVVKTEVEKADVGGVKTEGMSEPDLPKSGVLLGVTDLRQVKASLMNTFATVCDRRPVWWPFKIFVGQIPK